MTRLRSSLARFIQDPATELSLIVLICLSVVLVVMEATLDRRGLSYGSIHVASDAITCLFVVELSIRYFIAQKKARFFRNYWIDILAVLPLLRAFRILRVLRLLRLLRLGVLLNRRLNAISGALAAGLGVQIGIFLVLGVILLVSGMAIYLLEGEQNPAFDSLGKALWWSFFTLVAGEPIGGEAITDPGRLITVMVVLGGLTMFAVFTGVVSAVMVQRLKTGMEVRDLGMDELREHVVICGWNRGGPFIIEELQSEPSMRHRSIVVVAEFSELPALDLHRVQRHLIYFHTGDYTSIDVLEYVGIRHAHQAILMADRSLPRSDQDRDARTVLAALTIEKLNPNIYTCAQLLDRRNNVQLRVAGVEDIVVGDEVASHIIATTVRNHGLTDVLDELLTVQAGNQLYKVPLPDHWAGLPLAAGTIRLKEDHDSILLAIERWEEEGRRSMVNPPLTEVLQVGDQLVLIARERPTLA